MRHVHTAAELSALHATGAGFIFNDFSSGPAGAQYNVLHTACCMWVGKMLDGAESKSRLSVRKIFFVTLDEAKSWLVANRGAEGHGWKRCTRCRPGERFTGDRPGRQAGTSPTEGQEAQAGTSAMLQAVAAPMSASWPVQTSFARPSSPPIRLPVPPRLASWNKADDPDQVRLAEYLAVADALFSPHCERLSGSLALRLDVGLPRAAGLLDHRDLDNYLLPLAARLSQSITGTFACVWGTKRHSASSYVRIEQATPASGSPSFDCCYMIRTNASSQSETFKKQIRDQLGTASPLPPGPVHMQLCFTVGPGRNWLNLWKPTIDALGKILGHAPAATAWAPLDGRIVDLGLHCRVDTAMGNEISIAIAAKRIRG